MRNARIRLGLLFLGCAALAVQLDGCAGSAPLGRLEDPLKHDVAAQEHYRIERLMPGTKVTLALRDSTTVRGRFAGLTTFTPEKYARRYAAWRLPDDAGTLPALGAQITWVSKSSKRTTALLEGFGFERVLVRSRGSDKPRNVSFRELEALEDSSGRSWSADTLTRMLMSGALPLVTAMTIRSEDATTDVPLDQIESVTYRPSNRRVVIGVVVAVTFVAVVIIAHSNQPKPKPRTLDCGSVEPYYTSNVGVPTEAVARLR